MKKFAIAVATGALAFGALIPAGASEHCAPGESEGTEVLTVEQSGSTIYQTENGAGITGGVGYLEAAASEEDGVSVHGTTREDGVNGDSSASADGVSICLNDVEV